MDRSEYLSDEEVKRVLDTVDRLAQEDIAKGRKHWPVVRMVAYLVLSLGWRVSEYTALKVEDLDLEGGYVRMIPLKKRKRTGRMVTDPDTGEQKPEWKPVRQIVTDPLPEDLCKRIAEYLEWREKAGVKGKALLVGERGPYRTRQGPQKCWDSALIAAGVTKEVMKRDEQTGELKKVTVAKYSIHKGRHTFVTDLLRKTKNLALVSRAAHHSNITTTIKIYGHIDDEELRGALTGLHERKG